MSKKTEIPPSPRPADTRERLLDTAIELIWQSSYDRVGVNEICETAGVTKGSFYHYFDSKAALFRATSEHYWGKIKQRLDEIFSPEHDALTRLELWIDYIVDKQKEGAECGVPVHGCPFFTSGAQCCTEEKTVREAAEEMAEKSLRYNTALVQALQAEGHVAKDIDAQQTGRFLSHFMHGLLMYGQVKWDLKAVTEDLRPGIYRLLGFKNPPTSTKA